VQSLRNVIFGSVFFATRSLFFLCCSLIILNVIERIFHLISFFLSALAVAVVIFQELLFPDEAIDSDEFSFYDVKLVILGGDFFCAFMMFVTCTRWASQLSFYVSTPEHQGEVFEVTSLCNRILFSHTSSHHHLPPLRKSKSLTLAMKSVLSLIFKSQLVN
jgi:hypothetical protein